MNNLSVIKQKIKLLKSYGYKYNKINKSYNKIFRNKFGFITTTIGIDIGWLSNVTSVATLTVVLNAYKHKYTKG